MASFIGEKADKAIFVGLYRRGTWRSVDNEQFLQRTSPGELENDVLRLEESWKERLHTREFGLD